MLPLRYLRPAVEDTTPPHTLKGSENERQFNMNILHVNRLVEKISEPSSVYNPFSGDFLSAEMWHQIESSKDRTHYAVAIVLARHVC